MHGAFAIQHLLHAQLAFQHKCLAVNDRLKLSNARQPDEKRKLPAASDAAFAASSRRANAGGVSGTS